MTKKVKAIVLSGNGTNCEMEMAHACKLAGSDQVDIVHMSELLFGEKKLDDYHFLNLPGGFLDGDDLGAAKAHATRVKYARVKEKGEQLFDQLLRFIRDGKLILGVCNGFQLMVKLGLLPGWDGDYSHQLATLTFNDSGRFEDRWVYLKVNDRSRSVYTAGIEKLYLPIRHGEGKFVPAPGDILARLHEEGQVVFNYSNTGCEEPVMDYPLNPNGSVDGIAGICDESGRLLGMMPHPEGYLHYTNHPRWTRERLKEEETGVTLFRNAIDFIRKHVA
jgi:phosphoribosylformylglycinamidine synthase